MKTANYNELSMIKQIALNLLKNIEEKILSGECSDDYIMSTVSKYNAESNGYINPKDYINYDKAMNMLGIKNRTTFSKVCKKYNIKNHTINNVKVGFRKEEIEKLSAILKLEQN